MVPQENRRSSRIPERAQRSASGPAPDHSGLRQLGLLVAGFDLAVTSFMASGIYSNSRLAVVAARSHEVSDNAMPSILELGAARRTLLRVQSDLIEAARGDLTAVAAVPSHVSLYEEQWHRYEELPQFPGEEELRTQAQTGLDTMRLAVDRERTRLEAGERRDAIGATDKLAPAFRDADRGLVRLIEFNHEQGKRAAAESDRAWARARRLSFAADALCALITGVLAWLGFRSTRRFMSSQKERADELEAFASRVAHDIRGPLSPALFSLQMLEREFPADDKHRVMIDRGLRSLKRVDQLVDGLLTFARAAAKPEVDAHAALSPVVAGVMQDVEAQADAAGVRVEADELPSCEVACAPGVLASIVMNLVSNAVKHMPPDTPEHARLRLVRIRAVVHEARVRIEVSDTGEGLPEALHEKVFEPYVRGDPRRPGLGLGLATVRRLVQAHGGRVGVRSRDGVGALFWFEMPLRSPRSTTEGATPRFARRPPEGPLRSA